MFHEIPNSLNFNAVNYGIKCRNSISGLFQNVGRVSVNRVYVAFFRSIPEICVNSIKFGHFGVPRLRIGLSSVLTID